MEPAILNALPRARRQELRERADEVLAKAGLPPMPSWSMYAHMGDSESEAV